MALNGAATFGRTGAPPDGPARRRFAVLVLAHDEEALIGRLIDNLHDLDYPSDRFDVCVVTDNCKDQTAPLARSFGARVYERHDRSQLGKGFALRWLLQQLARDRESPRYEAFVVLDADSVVDRDFLRRMDARLEVGSQVIQAYYSVLNPDASPLAALRYAALTAIHYLRPLGRSVLGLSCGLKGNGMCFAAPVFERFAWNWFTLAEDVEFHLALVREGIRVDFASETSVLADMPTTFAQATSQNDRWERGRIQLLRHALANVLTQPTGRGSALRLDAAAEQLIPPLSVPFALGGLCLVGGVALRARVPACLAALSVAGQVGHLLAGLRFAGAPWRAYLALGHAPLYVLWKVGLYGRARFRGGGSRWVRTTRTSAAARAA